MIERNEQGSASGDISPKRRIVEALGGVAGFGLSIALLRAGTDTGMNPALFLTGIAGECGSLSLLVHGIFSGESYRPEGSSERVSGHLPQQPIEQLPEAAQYGELPAEMYVEQLIDEIRASQLGPENGPTEA